MLAITKILFSRDSSKNHSYVTLGQFLTLQAYLVPVIIIIATICSPALYMMAKNVSEIFENEPVLLEELSV